MRCPRAPGPPYGRVRAAVPRPDRHVPRQARRCGREDPHGGPGEDRALPGGAAGDAGTPLLRLPAVRNGWDRRSLSRPAAAGDKRKPSDVRPGIVQTFLDK
ncbi:hypothetical protein GCM10010466_04610 [Planomonospora alba]|uniref:Uncharacterized protein n=1 Tax=Planomonospora alba TaxID=161354 RepID=A0ABP6MJF0_9ACTN